MLGVHQGDDAVDGGLGLHLVVHEERLRDRAGVGHAGRLDEDVVELVPPLHQVAEDADEVAADGAADAPVVHLEDLLLRVDDQLLVDADLAELVFDDGDALAVVGGEDVVEQSRLAGAEEAGEYGDGHAVGRGRGHGGWLLFVEGQQGNCTTRGRGAKVRRSCLVSGVWCLVFLG